MLAEVAAVGTAPLVVLLDEAVPGRRSGKVATTSVRCSSPSLISAFEKWEESLSHFVVHNTENPRSGRHAVALIGGFLLAVTVVSGFRTS